MTRVPAGEAVRLTDATDVADGDGPEMPDRCLLCMEAIEDPDWAYSILLDGAVHADCRAEAEIS